MVALGRAPLRSPRFAWGLCSSSWLREAATSFGGRRRLLMHLRPCPIVENRSIPDMSHRLARRVTPANATGPPTRAQQGRPPVPPGRQRTSDTTPKRPQAAPARKPIASLRKSLRPQAKRGGVRGQPWCCLGLAAPVALWFFPASGKERPAHQPMCKGNSTPSEERERPCPRIGHQLLALRRKKSASSPAPRAKSPLLKTAKIRYTVPIHRTYKRRSFR